MPDFWSAAKRRSIISALDKSEVSTANSIFYGPRDITLPPMLRNNLGIPACRKYLGPTDHASPFPPVALR
mgnify:CR=1 FL=1